MSDWTVDVLGDSAVRACVEGDASLAANVRVHGLAAALRQAAIPGVRDLVPGMRELVVHVDPHRGDLHQVQAAVGAIARMVRGGTAESGAFVETLARRVEIPVTYGGDAGPDLEAVAAACGLDAAEVCRRHAAVEYVVCFTGFLPGFPYLGLLEPALRVPRRDTPRVRVPAGAVAIAGEYTGIYPADSPGGWHVIGHTDVMLFDLEASQPARLTPGMRVQFVPRHLPRDC